MSTTLVDRPVWKSHKGTGTTVFIDEMVDEHLQYTVAMIRRGVDRKGTRVSAESIGYLPALEAEMRKRRLAEILVIEEGWDA
jgi:hypothetical protein